MENNSTFFYNQTINIFTDASCLTLKPNRGDVQSTSPGFLATYGGRIIASGLEAYIGENSMYGESKAIEIAIDWCIHAASSGIFVPQGYSIFSDNNPTIQKICNTLISWFNILENKESNGILPREKMSVVSFEANAYNAAFSIFTSGLPIRLFYVVSHVNLRPFSHVKQQEKFLRINKPIHGDLSDDLTIAILHEQATFNNMVDIMTRNYLIRNQNQIEQDINYLNSDIDFNNKIVPIRWPFLSQQVSRYLYQPLFLN